MPPGELGSVNYSFGIWVRNGILILDKLNIFFIGEHISCFFGADFTVIFAQENMKFLYKNSNNEIN